MKALLACAAALLLPLSALAQIWGAFTDMTYMKQPVASGSSLPALPQPGNITMYWDSGVAPQGKTIVWRDLTNNVPFVAIFSNSPSFGYMYNTPDGMIISSAVMGNNGESVIPSGKLIGTNYSFWVTMKREDHASTQSLFMNPPTAGYIGQLDGWMNLWNLGSYPAYVTPVTNLTIGSWTDIVLTFQNKTNYIVYLDGVQKTNWSDAALYDSNIRDIGYSLQPSPSWEKIGQMVVWTNKILTASEVATLHQRMTNTMVDIPRVTNSPPAISGLRNTWRTAGYLGLYRTNKWMDSTSGKSFTCQFDPRDPTYWERMFNVTGRGMRVWSGAGFNYDHWTGGDMVLPSSYTLFYTFSPIHPSNTAVLFYTTAPGALYWGAASGLLRFGSGTGHILSPVLGTNRTHTIMAVDSGTTITSYVDGAYYTNVTASWNGQSVTSLGTSFQVGFSIVSNLLGSIGEFLIATNTSLSTNDAVTYHTYATNQYGFDWYGVTNTTPVATNAYGYYFMPCSSNLWASPILQQQTVTTGSGGFLGTGTSWAHQKIKNTSSTETRIKNIRVKLGEQGGVNPVNAYVFVSKTNYSVSTPSPFPDMTYGISATNTIAAGSGAAFRDFVFDQANTPIIPPNQDFYIIVRATGSGALDVYYSTATGGTLYQDTNYSYDQGATEAVPTGDMGFEIYICQ